MRTFSIAELEALSGTKAHALRMWEKRYLAFNPLRKKGNVRAYSVNDLQRFLQLSLLNRNGFKVSSLFSLTGEQLEEKINKLKDDQIKQENTVNELIVSMYRLDIEYFEFIIRQCMSTWHTDIFLSAIVCKFLEKTGLQWQGNRLTEEHFVVTALRNKIIRCIEDIEVYGKKEIRILLFLPEAGQVDLMLLYTMYQLKTKGLIVYYMGHDVSISNLKMAIEVKQPDFIFSYFPQSTSFKIDELASIMDELAPSAKFIIVNRPDNHHITKDDDNVICLDYEEALSFVDIECSR